jgi:hypothetical protein
MAWLAHEAWMQRALMEEITNMDCFDEQSVPVHLDEHVKMLEDEELLDFWEESQYMEGVFAGQHAISTWPQEGYERLILQELQLRFCQRIPGKIAPAR